MEDAFVALLALPLLVIAVGAAVRVFKNVSR